MKKLIGSILLILLFIVAFADGGVVIGDSGELVLESDVIEHTESPVLADGSNTTESDNPEAAPVIDPSTPVIIEAEQVVLYDNTVEEYAFSSDILNGGYYFSADTSELGEVSIFVPYEYQYGSFTTNSTGNLVSLRSSTVTGIMYRGSTAYTIRWTAFSTPQYRFANTTGYTYEDLTVSNILSTNVEVLNDYEKIPLFPNADLIRLLMLLGIGVIIVCLFMKR